MSISSVLRSIVTPIQSLASKTLSILGPITIGLGVVSYSTVSYGEISTNAFNTTTSTKSQSHVEQNKTFTVGVLSTKARKHIGLTSPLAKYVGQQLAPYGYVDGRVKVTNSILELGQWLDKGDIDMVSETLFTALKLQQEHSADISLHRWKKGHAEYQTVFFARKDSGIHSLEDLIGKTLVLEDRSSTSGFYMPLQTLLKKPLALSSQTSPSQGANPDDINIVVAGDVLRRADEISLSTWVAHGQADAGAFANTNWEDSGDMPPHIKPEMEIIYRTEFVPRSVVLLRRDLPIEVKKVVEIALINANQSTEGKAALHKFQKTSKFEAFSPEQLQSFTDYNQSRMQIERMWFQ